MGHRFAWIDLQKQSDLSSSVFICGWTYSRRSPRLCGDFDFPIGNQKSQIANEELMLVIPPIKYQKRNVPLKKKQPAAPKALTLVSATYDPTGPRVTLTFDRAVDASGMDVGQVRVFDGATTFRNYVGQGVQTAETPQSVRVSLQELGATGAGNVTLTVLEENGIVAVDDGGTWSGVSDLSLPFEA
jgi:hypothetical protein